MKKVYRSKIGVEIVAILLIALVSAFYTMVSQHDYNGLPMLVAVTAFIIHLFATTKYTVNNTVLLVQSSFIINKTVRIRSITKIKGTYNPISAPAASIDRLQVYQDNGSSVIISPKDKNGFVSHLQSLNPNIMYMPRNTRAGKDDKQV